MEHAEAQRTERFLTAFNRIERYLKHATGLPDHEPMTAAMRRFFRQQPEWRRLENPLHAFRELRNLIVHERYDPYTYLAVPSETVTQHIEQTARALEHPKRADQTYGRPVLVLDGEDPLERFLDEAVRQADIDQVPVYQDGTFAGLLTGWDATRWWAQASTGTDAASVPVKHLLNSEPAPDRVVFIARDASDITVRSAFEQLPGLVCALITEAGRRDAKPVGIATAYDLVAVSVT